MFILDNYLKERAALIECALASTVAAHGGLESRLFEAMRYSLLGGGKRLRPILALAACEAVGGSIDAAMNFACAVEMIHTYSLIHDDLPIMDNDDLRHGKPTNHKVYGDAIATLAGDALVTDAFGVIARSPLAAKSPAIVLEVIAELSNAAGSAGMVAGQVIDLLGEGRTMNLEQLEYLHGKKTGALFLASVRGGARLGGATSSRLDSLTKYAQAMGLSFQVVDDLLDVEASTEQMGKRTNKDQAAGKNTYPVLMGIERSRQLARDLQGRANAALSSFDTRADPLRAIANFIVERKH
ncbi:MAG TPA: farnesyl diphosphate synthase [Candidatus Binataceae bacterium]|nr:farnesyl diphosphate synthase [Candidatus Binataceae bacterium]